MKINSIAAFQTQGIRLLLSIVFFAGIQSAAIATPDRISRDSIPVNLPCYHQLEKEVFQSGFHISAHASSIQGGIVDFVAAVAKSNRSFRRCLQQHYPLGKK
ncbi:MAG: hypothetical protein IT262_23720 [Saprospiraceae bacterium]|nr:hypothetical protein [Saprospiraceae bacterium]